jgi:hypothetical protein
MKQKMSINRFALLLVGKVKEKKSKGIRASEREKKCSRFGPINELM